MKRKDGLAIDKILECAKKEFLEKGFEKASMRDIADSAGYTTGMLYARFADKGELFKTLVKDSADRLYEYYLHSQTDFAHLSPDSQFNDMHGYVDARIDEMIDIIYGDFDTFKLIISKSKGSEYEDYVERLIKIETDNTVRFISDMNKAGYKMKPLRADLSHMLATAMFNGMFQVVEHDFTKEEAKEYIKELETFFNAGYDKILGLPSNWEPSRL